MKADLNAAKTVFAVDTTRVQSLYIQCQPISGSASTGVVEVKQAFSGDLHTPSVSFSSAETLDLSGDSITAIDVTDVAWVHIVVTTAESGVSVDVAHRVTGVVNGRVMRTTADLGAPGVRDRFGTLGDYLARVLAVPHEAVSTGELEVRHSVDPSFTAVSFSPAADLTLDGSTITEMAVEAAGALHTICTTSQSGLVVDLYWYLRDEVNSDS